MSWKIQVKCFNMRKIGTVLIEHGPHVPMHNDHQRSGWPICSSIFSVISSRIFLTCTKLVFAICHFLMHTLICKWKNHNKMHLMKIFPNIYIYITCSSNMYQPYASLKHQPQPPRPASVSTTTAWLRNSCKKAARARCKWAWPGSVWKG